MVLAHELAHLRRGDHRVRVLELVVSTVYWWHPLVWWARRQLHAAEEQCCDAWVAWAYPDSGREYARSLLTAAELLSSHSPRPELASPFLNPLTLKARIEVVLQNSSQRSASLSAVLGLVLVAAGVIPIGVRGAARSHKRGDDGSTTATKATGQSAREVALVAEPKEPGETPADDSAKNTAAIAQSGDEKPLARELQPFQGTWNFGACESELWEAELEEIQKTWTWRVQGQEIKWIRWGKEVVKLSFTVDPSKTPKQIDFTFLDGPDKGEKCQGIYFASRHEINICFQDPGATVERPKNTGSKPGSQHTSVTLVPSRILPLAEELQALQGVWKFDIYYSDWWPERISDPPISWSKWRWTVKGNEIRWTGMKVEDVKLAFTLDPSKSPRQIDMTFLDGPHKGKVLRGTYKFRPGDDCDLCFADPDAGVDRPSAWSYSTNAGRTAVSIKRVAPDPTGDSGAPVAAAGAAGRGPEIDAAIDRLRRLGTFVREFHPRGDPEYWVQIISTGLGATTLQSAPNFDDAAMDDVETIARGVPLDLHLRRTAVTAAGLARLGPAGRIDSLELSGPDVDEAMLKILPKLPLKGQLALESDLLTDTAIETISQCRDLTSVSLAGALFTDKCLEQLTGLPKLKAVSLGNSFTRGAFDVLSRVKGLTSLDASALTPDLDDLRKFPNLTRLSLSGLPCNDEAAETIADTFHSLEQAYLRRTSITNAGVEHLSRIKTLKILTLDDAPIDDGVADSIRKMKQLTWLSVGNCAIGDDTVAALSECPEMWYVYLHHTRVTDAGVARLTKLKKPLALYLSRCPGITDASVELLAELPDSSSHHINLQNSGITEAGARQLQRALPHAQITWGVPPVRLKSDKRP